MPLLEVSNLSVRYDKAQILNGISLRVDESELVGLVGPNGAGKSTLLRAISGLVRFEERMKRGTTGDIVLEGEVRFAGERIDALPAHEIRMRGLVHCPERRRPFKELSVLENLLAGAFLSKSQSQTKKRLEHCFMLFPRLSERKEQIAGTLSGGEQQMLAVARILRTGARLLLLDEISEGLAPVIVQKLGEVIRTLKQKGYTVVLVEQNFRFAAPLADRFYVMEHGKIVKQFEQSELQSNMDMLREYLGV